ncbi:N-6 DNA methylase [Candidatus Kapabacteria bacterium]|nr:N-6 DNA methylase [Candidatus Kapabacteria bacterium]
MNLAQIETKLKKLVASKPNKDFIYEMLRAYGLPKASITRLQKGNLNLSKNEGEISWKKKLFFKEINGEDLHQVISELQPTLTHEQRFTIVTDYKALLAIDNKTDDKLDIDFIELPKHFDFFLPWAGMEKAQHQNENPADVKAAEKMAKLFDEIKKDNPSEEPEFIHGLNVFLSRLLFCYFAEDTNIFKANQFTNAISSHTSTDGSDLSDLLNKLFDVLNTSDNDRVDLPKYLSDFPYVNGGLFEKEYKAPIFTRRSRQAIIDSGELDWSAINPDIFGSMIQAVITPEHRGGLGMHYTSVPNIMKVIEPFFLNDLYEEFEKGKSKKNKLNELLNRIKRIKIFDPACGSGNFLIIAYKELRKLEMKIFKESALMPFSGISLSNFYGIELDDFAHEIAKLSLWLAEHQMNVEFFQAFGKTNPTLPLKEAGNIVHGNACRLDWEEVCPKSEDDEIYILGNPPYLGGKLQNESQKNDTALVFMQLAKFNNIDYIGCWFYKASIYLKENIKVAFVSTNSICQGTQVKDLWQPIFQLNIEIDFAVKDFVWSNNAKNKAAVICSIIGLKNKSVSSKKLYIGEMVQVVENINAYLLPSPNIFIEKRTKPLSVFPKMIQGNIVLDDGHLQLTRDEKDSLLLENPLAQRLIKRIYGSKELISDIERYCLWIKDEDLDLANGIIEIKERIEKVRIARLKGATNARSCADRPHQFCMLNTTQESQIIIPRVSTIRREYIPTKFLDKENIATDAAQVILDAEPYIFGILNSKIHIKWVKSFAGKLKNDFRYSAGICWYSFPFPKISKQRKDEITQCVFRILEEREKHPEKTLAKLYDPDKMPEGLREAHRLNDLAIERCYRSKPFDSDEERLEHLFKLYEKMIAEEKEQDSLFKTEKKTRRKKK